MKRSVLTTAFALVSLMFAAGEAQAALTANPVSVKFPDTPIQVVSQSIHVSFNNNTGMQVKVTSITISGPDAAEFDFKDHVPPPMNVQLPDMLAMDVDVIFQPMTGGAKAATLTALLSDLTTTDVPLTGNGLGPNVSIKPSPVFIGNVPYVANTPVSPYNGTISNSGGGTITVQSVIVTGGDKQAFGLSGLPQFPIVLSQGQGFNFSMSWTPTKAGQAAVALQINSDDPNKPQWNAPVIAYVGDPKAVADVANIPFGMTNVGQQTQSSPINIKNTGFSDLTILSLTMGGANPNDFVAVPAGFPPLPATVKVGTSYPFSAYFLPVAQGARSATIQVNTNDPLSPTLIQVSGMATGPLTTVAPPSLDFGVVRVGKTPKLAFTVSNGGTGPVDLSGWAIGGPDAASFTWGNKNGDPGFYTIDPGKSLAVPIIFSPSTMKPNYAASVTFQTSDADNLPNATVGLTGSAVAGILDCSPANIDFGSGLIEVGKMSMPQTCTVKNTGSEDVNVFGTIGTAEFTWSNGPPDGKSFLLPKGMSRDYTLIYSPTSNVGDSGAATFTSPDIPAPYMDSCDCLLSGSGAEAQLDTLPMQDDTYNFDAQAPMGPTLVGSSKQLMVKVRNTGTAQLHIMDVTILQDDGMGNMVAAVGFSLDKPGPFLVDAMMSEIVTVTFTPDTVRAMPFLATFTVDPDQNVDPNIPPVTFTLTGTAAPNMLTVLTEAADNGIDFGQVMVGASSGQKLITIFNGATASQNVVVAAPPPFTVDQTAQLTIPAMSKATIKATFAPTAAMTYADFINISLPGGKSPVAKVAVHGVGTAGQPMVDAGTNMTTPRGCSIGGSSPMGMAMLLGLIALGLVVRRRRR